MKNPFIDCFDRSKAIQTRIPFFCEQKRTENAKVHQFPKIAFSLFLRLTYNFFDLTGRLFDPTNKQVVADMR
jgi:hypothetical protein